MFPKVSACLKMFRIEHRSEKLNLASPQKGLNFFTGKGNNWKYIERFSFSLLLEAPSRVRTPGSLPRKQTEAWVFVVLRLWEEKVQGKTRWQVLGSTSVPFWASHHRWWWWQTLWIYWIFDAVNKYIDGWAGNMLCRKWLKKMDIL